MLPNETGKPETEVEGNRTLPAKFRPHNGFEARDGHQIRVHFRYPNLHHSRECGHQKSPTGP